MSKSFSMSQYVDIKSMLEARAEYYERIAIELSKKVSDSKDLSEESKNFVELIKEGDDERY